MSLELDRDIERHPPPSVWIRRQPPIPRERFWLNLLLRFCHFQPVRSLYRDRIHYRIGLPFIVLHFTGPRRPDSV